MATATDKEIQELRSELAELREEFSAIGKTMGRIAQSATDEGKERLRSVADRSREQAGQTWSAFEREVEERPMTSLAAAFGIGLLLGKLLDR